MSDKKPECFLCLSEMRVIPVGSAHQAGFSAYCPNCGTTGPKKKTEEEALECWEMARGVAEEGREIQSLRNRNSDLKQALLRQMRWTMADGSRCNCDAGILQNENPEAHHGAGCVIARAALAPKET